MVERDAEEPWKALERRLLSEFEALAATCSRIEARLDGAHPVQPAAPDSHPLTPAAASKPREALPAADMEQLDPEGKKSSVFSLQTRQDGDLRDGEGEVTDQRFVASSLPLNWPASLKPRLIFGQKLRESSVEQQITNVHLKRSSTSIDESYAVEYDEDEQDTRKSWTRRIYIIDPNSNFQVFYSSLSLVILIFDLTVLPYTLAWDVPSVGFFAVANILTPCFWTVDVFLNMITGFYSSGVLVMTFEKIVKHYLETWFFPDIVVVFCDWTSLVIGLRLGEEGNSGRSLKMLRFTKLGRLLRMMGMLRMLRLVRILEELAHAHLSEGSRLVFRMLNLVICILWASHLFSCMWFMVGDAGPSDTGLHWIDLAGIMVDGVFIPFEDTDRVYQYMVSFHWAAAQISLGAIDIYPTNSLERGVFVAATMVGFLFGSTVVSMLSAAMMDYQMNQKDRTVKIMTLRQYLRENMVEAQTAVRVQKQVEQRLWQRERLEEKDVAALQLLSANLRMSLRLEIQRPHLIMHPLMRLFLDMDVGLMRRVCSEAVSFLFLRAKDDLFSPGTVAAQAFTLTSGSLSYSQSPASSPVGHPCLVHVQVGAWMCEAALWCEWIHVGKAEASTSCQLLGINGEEFIENLQKNMLIHGIALEYGRAFHKRTVAAKPPVAKWPTDLDVPFTDYCDLVGCMQDTYKNNIGMNAMAVLTKNVAKGHFGKPFAKLEEEVVRAKSMVVVTGDGSVFRVVNMIAMKIKRRDSRLLAQVGSHSGGAHTKANVQLPGCKQESHELVAETVERFFQTKLRILKDKVDVIETRREILEQMSKDYGVQTRYIKAVCTAELKPSLESQTLDAPVCTISLEQMVAPPPDRRSVKMPERRGSVGNSSNAQMVLELMSTDVYVVRETEEKVNLFAWLSQEQFDFLASPLGEQTAKQWLAMMVLPPAPSPRDDPDVDDEMDACDGDLIKGEFSF